MQIHLTDSTAAYRTGLGPCKRLFKVSSGPYAGRMVVLIQTSPTEIKLTYADYPYLQWSTPSTLVSDAADYPFDADMDVDNNIHLVYTLGSNNNLVSHQLTFTGGLWTVGSQNTIYNADANYFSSMMFLPTGRIWVCWSRLSGGSYYVNAKFSDDEGATWVSDESSYGFTISSAATAAFSKMTVLGSYVYVIYTTDGTKLSFRRMHFDVGGFESEVDIATGSGFDENFDSAVSDDGRLGIVYEDGQIRYREFDGSSWGGIINIDSGGGIFPQLKYVGNCPYVIYLSTFNGAQNQVLYSRRPGSSFSTPALLDSRKSIFDKVLCYNSVVAGYSDLTTASGNSTTGDVYHPDSSALFKETGDALYLGMDDRSHYLKIALSTSGAGGNVSWQYFNGIEWISFVPSGGAFNFNLTDRELLLWDDYASIPNAWQKNEVNGANYFWIRIVVSAAYSTGPVGTQITPVSNVNALILME